MIYSRPPALIAVDQGDLIEGCPIPYVESLDPDGSGSAGVLARVSCIYVLTQTCDLAQGKVSRAVVAPVLNAHDLIMAGALKSADVRGPIRAGRVHGWYFLPKSLSLRFPESIVDLRSLHTVALAVLQELCRSGKRVAHVESPYREHLAKHFADTYSRIGLPLPYETE